MQWLRLRKPRAVPRRCSRRPLIASVGPLLLPGRSKERGEVSSALFQGSTEPVDLDQRDRNATVDTFHDGFHHRLTFHLVDFSVGCDDALVEASCRFDPKVLVTSKQRVESVAWPDGEEAIPGMKGAAGLVERVAGPFSMSELGLLYALSAAVQTIASETDNVGGIHHGDSIGELFGSGGLESGEHVDRDDLDPILPLLRPCGEPLFEHCLRTALDHVQQPCRPAPVEGWGEVNHHGDVRIALEGVSPNVLINTESGHTVEPVWVIDETPLALSEDRRVRGRPRHPVPWCGAGD